MWGTFPSIFPYLITEGPSWGHPRLVLGAIDPYLAILWAFIAKVTKSSENDFRLMFEGSCEPHRRSFVGVSRPRSWSRFPVLGAI